MLSRITEFCPRWASASTPVSVTERTLPQKLPARTRSLVLNGTNTVWYMPSLYRGPSLDPRVGDVREGDDGREKLGSGKDLWRRWTGTYDVRGEEILEVRARLISVC